MTVVEEKRYILLYDGRKISDFAKEVGQRDLWTAEEIEERLRNRDRTGAIFDKYSVIPYEPRRFTIKSVTTAQLVVEGN